MSAAALTKPAFAVIAEFSSAATLYEAAEKVRDAGYQILGCSFPLSNPRDEQGDGSREVASGIHYLLRRVPRVYDCRVASNSFRRPFSFR